MGFSVPEWGKTPPWNPWDLYAYLKYMFLNYGAYSFLHGRENVFTAF